MFQGPKTGDRVRLATRDFEPDYQRGEAGTVFSGPHPIPSGGFYCVVTMDKDGPGAAVIVFNSSEIELDAA
ncbi:MAG TPA: hypothetical protein VH643_12615 [Gemmataceae bacterium]|jgi:hypothetical protein